MIVTETCGSCSCLPLWERTILRIISPGKDPNSEIEVWFLLTVSLLHPYKVENFYVKASEVRDHLYTQVIYLAKALEGNQCILQ